MRWHNNVSKKRVFWGLDSERVSDTFCKCICQLSTNGTAITLNSASSCGTKPQQFGREKHKLQRLQHTLPTIFPSSFSFIFIHFHHFQITILDNFSCERPSLSRLKLDNCLQMSTDVYSSSKECAT